MGIPCDAQITCQWTWTCVRLRAKETEMSNTHEAREELYLLLYCSDCDWCDRLTPAATNYCQPSAASVVYVTSYCRRTLLPYLALTYSRKCFSDFQRSRVSFVLNLHWHIQCESKKPLRFSEIFSQTVGNF